MSQYLSFVWGLAGVTTSEIADNQKHVTAGLQLSCELDLNLID